jgi:DNA-binding transcriptional LysR family regulator
MALLFFREVSFLHNYTDSTVNFEHLKVFYVAATKKNFSETARILHLSQPTVSLQIQQLEASLNARLFDRTTKQIRLTDYGEVLFKYAEQILSLINQAKREIDLLGESVHGNLNIGASLTIGEYFLPYLLGKFSREFPRINLLVNTENSNKVIQQLVNGEIDIGFIEAPLSQPRLHQHALYEDELVIISSVKDQHPLIADRDMITAKELFSLPIILRERGSGTRQVIEECLYKNGLDPHRLNVVLEVSNTESIKAVVESGLGISIISQYAIKKELQLGMLRQIKIQGIKLNRFFNLVYDKNKVLSLPAEAFLHFMLKQFHLPQEVNVMPPAHA